MEKQQRKVLEGIITLLGKTSQGYFTPQTILPLAPDVETNDADMDDQIFRRKQATKFRVWKRMSDQLLTQEHLLELYQTLEKWSDRCPTGCSESWFAEYIQQRQDSKTLGFDKYIDALSFLKARSEMHPRIQSMLTMGHFYRMLQGSDDKKKFRVPIMLLFNYVMKKVWLQQTRLALMNHDHDGRGCVTEDGFEMYLKEIMPTLHHLEGLDDILLPYYLCTATRRFFFFLDPHKIGRVKIEDILTSMLMDDILELREIDVKETNWFSKESMTAIYRHYLNLDNDENGMLKQNEFVRFCYSMTGTKYSLTKTFVKELFNEKMTYSGEMDYRAYVDFVLAMENRKDAVSIAYFANVLDVDKKSYINAFDINYFYKEIFTSLSSYNPELPRMEDIKDEIFDMVKPVHPFKITVKDLIRCGKGDQVISMLIDFKGFDDYENRDNLSPMQIHSQLRTLESLALSPPTSPTSPTKEVELVSSSRATFSPSSLIFFGSDYVPSNLDLL